MASKKFCRAKAPSYEPCLASAGLAIVQDLLANGASSLADDVRANLYQIDTQLQVLKTFQEEFSGAAAAQRKSAATTPGAATKLALPSVAKEHKKNKKDKVFEEGFAATGAKKQEQENPSAKKHKKGDKELKGDSAVKESKKHRESKEGTAVKESKKHKESKEGGKEHRREESKEGTAVKESKKHKESTEDGKEQKEKGDKRKRDEGEREDGKAKKKHKKDMS